MVDQFFLRIEDKEIYLRFKTLCLQEGTTIQNMIWQLIQKKMIQVDGEKNNLERFFDSKFVPKPDIHDDLEKKILPYLRIQDDDPLNKLRITFGHGFIYASALLDTPKPDRRDCYLDYRLLWKRYWR